MQQNKSSLIIRTMEIEDIDAVVDIHRRCFSEKVSLFSVLNPRLAWHLYAGYVKELQSVGFVLVDSTNGAIAGYAAGTLRPGFHRRFLVRNCFYILWYTFLGMLTKPAVWKIVTRAIFSNDPFNTYRKDPVRYEGTPPSGPVGYFMPIAINPDYRGGGNAVRLAQALMEHFQHLGVARIRGNKIAINNIASQKLFVEKLGWSSTVIQGNCYIVWKEFDETGTNKQTERWTSRPMKLFDLSKVTKLYMRCFPKRDNTLLGQSHLERFCLQALLENNSTVVVIEDADTHQIVAAAAGTMCPGFTLRFIKQNKFFFINRLFIAFLKHPVIRKKVFQRLFFNKKSEKSKYSHIDIQTGHKIPPGSQLNHLFVCVSPDFQKKGLGKMILSYFMTTLFQMGAERIWGCVETTNTASLKLHDNLGWKSQQTSDEWITVWVDAP